MSKAEFIADYIERNRINPCCRTQTDVNVNGVMWLALQDQTGAWMMIRTLSQM